MIHIYTNMCLKSVSLMVERGTTDAVMGVQISHGLIFIYYVWV